MGQRLLTPRLLLRPMVEADAAIYTRLYTNGGVMRFVAAPLSLQAARRAFELVLAQARATPPRAHYWICHSRERGNDAGLLALLPDRDDDASAEVGILLLPEAQGQGYATEAIAALADHALSGLVLQRLWTRHARDNQAMIGLMQALGFHPDAGASDGELRWSLRCKDWPPTARLSSGLAKPGRRLAGD
jgi:RimJ/RimL family protein N-acetyltransferase